MTDKTIVEINGVKLEVDMRYATRVEELRVGDKVKILTKDYSDHNVSPGVIVGFEPFSKLPTIICAYVSDRYGETGKVKFVHYNAKSKDVEIVRAADDDLDLDRQQVMNSFDRAIATKQKEIEVIEEHRRYFDTNFAQYWTAVKMPTPVDEAS